MTHHLSDLKTFSPELEDSGYAAFVQGLGLLNGQELNAFNVESDEFQSILAELKREALNQDVNPLIGAAAFLFARIFQLEQGRYRVETQALQRELINKVKCFAHYAQEAGYQVQVVMAARYLLCAWIDEYLDSSPLGKERSWIQGGLLKIFQFDPSGADRFFLILKRSLDHSKSHIDLLELIYLCLSFGFKGPYRYQAEGQRDLAIITDHLYHHIRSIRGDFSKSLLVGEAGMFRLMLSKPSPQYRVLCLPFLLSVLTPLTFVILNHQLGAKLAPLLQTLSRLVA